MRIILLGFTVPDDVIAEINRLDANIATQTHRFAWGLATALRSAGADVSLLSAAPASDYPRNPRLLWRGGSFEHRQVIGRLLPFVNLMLLKHLTRFISLQFVGRRLLAKVRPDWIVVHGVHTPFLWFAVTYRRRAAPRVCVVLTDPPGVILANDRRSRRLLKRIDIWLTKKALARADATVVLAEPLARDFAPTRPYIVMEGLFDAAEWAAQPPVPANIPTVTYAGGLHESYGVGMLADAIATMATEDVRLRLLGKGPLESELARMAAADHRIIRPTLVDATKVEAIYRDSTVLVQPRQVDQGFVKYSFPSKLLEYMASGVPVVSTRLPSIPREYEPYVVWANDSVEGLREAISQVLCWTEDERREFGSAAAQFVRKTRSAEAQGARVVDFFERCGCSGS